MSIALYIMQMVLLCLLVSSRKVLNNNVRYMKYMIYYPELVRPNDKQLIVFV